MNCESGANCCPNDRSVKFLEDLLHSLVDYGVTVVGISGELFLMAKTKQRMVAEAIESWKC